MEGKPGGKSLGTDTLERVSLEEFQRLPEEDGRRVELSRGRLIREPRPGAEHGWLAGRVFRAVDAYVEEHGAGLVIFETGFLLNVEPPTVRGPDVAFIAEANLPSGGVPSGFWTVPPDLAVEVVSPSNTSEEMQEKVLQYLEADTRLVWVVDPGTRSVTVYRSRNEIRLLTEGDTLDGADVLPGFRLSVADLFGTTGGS